MISQLLIRKIIQLKRSKILLSKFFFVFSEDFFAWQVDRKILGQISFLFFLIRSPFTFSLPLSLSLFLSLSLSLSLSIFFPPTQISVHNFIFTVFTLNSKVHSHLLLFLLFFLLFTFFWVHVCQTNSGNLSF